MIALGFEQFDNDDGRTWEATILAAPNMHRQHRIKYRPLSNQARAQALSVSRGMDPGKANAMLSGLLASYIEEWTLHKIEGAQRVPLDITQQNCMSLKPVLQLRLFSIVLWGNSGDLDPSDVQAMTTEEVMQLAEESEASIVQNIQEADVRLDDLEKN